MELATDYHADTYDEAVRTYGLDQSDYEGMMEELETEAQESFEITHDTLGHFCDLFEAFDFEYHHTANTVELRHPSRVNDPIEIGYDADDKKFSVDYHGKVSQWDTAQQVIGQIIVTFPFLDREDVFRDADLYGWGLPEFAGPRVIADEDSEG